jgi:molybdopterin-containing oxidoreductase family iron-sulfur binding subunit
LDPVDGASAGAEGLESLVEAMQGDEVDLLLLMDVNPVFTAVGDAGFRQAMERFRARGERMSVHVGAYVDETAVLATHHVPLSHGLETWGDLRGHEGTAGIVQPLIEPLWGSKSMVEFLAALARIGEKGAAGVLNDVSGYEVVRGHWLEQWGKLSAGDREMRWRKSLRDGVIEQTAMGEAKTTLADAGGLLDALRRRVADGGVEAAGIELTFRLDPTLGDGEAGWANHPWLQELPKPLTHLTWDNLVLMGPATAKGLGIEEWGHESRRTVPVVRIEVGGEAVEMPAWVQVGHPEKTVTLFVGSGHTAGGSVQARVGTNVFPLRTKADRWHRSGGVQVSKMERRADVACQQPTQVMSGREVARSRKVELFPSGKEGGGAPDLYSSRRDERGKSVHLSLYDENRYAGYKWGMVIDLGACIGCNACVIACQAENNIPTVGKEQVRRGREMHWLRIDTYYGETQTRSLEGLGGEVAMHFMPMMCQHCENAPCEVVCPVEATTHSSEGINEMTYNRCVGTRYCSNNCPYKVRRFNFLAWNKDASHGIPSDAGALAAMQKNPNVTVRSRGVMEKCTYCIQRINRARIDAKRAWANSGGAASVTRAPEMREAASDGWLEGGKAEDLPRLRFQTACQQACPTEAIVFGDLNDDGTWVKRLKTEGPWTAIQYGVLTELNTQPRTSYLERLTNPNPAMDSGGGGGV